MKNKADKINCFNGLDGLRQILTNQYLQFSPNPDLRIIKASWNK